MTSTLRAAQVASWLAALCVSAADLSSASGATQPRERDAALSGSGVYPGETWAQKTPAETGLKPELLPQVAAYLGGRGMVVRHGYQVFSWGDVSQRADIASAAKPFYSHLLLRAIELGRLPSVDETVMRFNPRLADLNAGLDHKDRRITFRHCANQISCYGVREEPGAAFDYNDFQMALFWDALFTGVYGAAPAAADERVFHPLLTDRLGCQDDPTMDARDGDPTGRVSISLRDHCRFGLLYLREGRWPAGADGASVQLLSPEHVRMATTSLLPLSLPRTKGLGAEMVSGQRTIGSRRVPDNQTDHLGCYSWLWWVNGVRSSGKRLWPDAPAGTFAALGHEHGMRGMVVVPSLDLVMAWNDTTLDRRPWADQADEPHPLNEALRLLVAATRP